MEGFVLFPPMLIVALVVAFYLFSSIKILNEYERAVVFRLGKLLPSPKGPGVVFIFAPLDRMAILPFDEQLRRYQDLTKRASDLRSYL